MCQNIVVPLLPVACWLAIRTLTTLPPSFQTETDSSIVITNCASIEPDHPAFSDLTRAPLLAGITGGPNQTTYRLSRGHDVENGCGMIHISGVVGLEAVEPVWLCLALFIDIWFSFV
jgi:hypothetical protein